MGDDDALGVAHAARAVRRGMSDGGSGGLRLPGLLKGGGEGGTRGSPLRLYVWPAGPRHPGHLGPPEAAPRRGAHAGGGSWREQHPAGAVGGGVERRVRPHGADSDVWREWAATCQDGGPEGAARAEARDSPAGNRQRCERYY